MVYTDVDVFISVYQRPGFVLSCITGEIPIISKILCVSSEGTGCVLFSRTTITFSHIAHPPERKMPFKKIPIWVTNPGLFISHAKSYNMTNKGMSGKTAASLPAL